MIRFLRNANRLIQHAIRAIRSALLDRLHRTWSHRRRPPHIHSYADLTVAHQHGGVERAATVTVAMLGDLIDRTPLSCQPQPGVAARR